MCRKQTKIMGFYIFVNQSTYVTASLYSIYCMISGNWDAKTWPLPFDFSVPFNDRTVWGWYIVCLLQFNLSLCYAFGLISVSSYYFCSCKYIITLCEHMRILIHSATTIFAPKDEDTVSKKTKKLFDNMKNEPQSLLEAQNQLKRAIELNLKIFE